MKFLSKCRLLKNKLVAIGIVGILYITLLILPEAVPFTWSFGIPIALVLMFSKEQWV
jgi:hypothetical protein